MTLEEIKDGIKEISLSHRRIKDFDYGEDFTLATGKGSKYPLTFLEIPYSANYELSNNKFKTFSFALLVLMKPSLDDVIGDHKGISEAEIIGDSIITKLQADLPELKLDSVTGLSLREFSDDNVSGFRFDITARTFRTCYNPDDFSK